MKLEALIAELLSADDARAEQAAQKLVALGAAALEPLLEILKSEDADERWWATRVLGETTAPDVTDLLLGQLSDPDEGVRAAAIHGLGLRGDAGSAEAIARQLSDASGYLARQAGEALTKLGDHAVPALIAGLQDENQRVRVESARALAHMEQLEAIPALFNALDDDSALVNYWADIGLERRGVGQVYFKP